MSTYVCPVYRMGQAGTGLWLYYACQWYGGACGSNPQPLYLSNSNAAYCPPTDPATTSGHYCVQIATYNAMPRDDGCENGYQGPCPPNFIEDSDVFEILKTFNGMYVVKGQKLQIRFYKLRLNANGGVWGLGFEDRNGDFPQREEKIKCCGPKGLDVAILDKTAPKGKLNYRVLLRRNSDSVCGDS